MSDQHCRYLVVDVEPALPDEDEEPPRIRRTFKLRPVDRPDAKPIVITMGGDHPDMTQLLYCGDTGAWCELKAGWLPPDYRVVI